MLSKTALLILGTIAEEPINPYAISKLINYTRRKIRGGIPTQTVYGIVNMLRKKRLISGVKINSGNMPDRTVYSITKKGEDLLKKNLLLYISEPKAEDTLSELVISTHLIGYLDRETVLKALKEYREKIEEEIEFRNSLHSSAGERRVSNNGKIIVEHVMDIIEVNLKTVNKLIRMAETDTQWDNFQVPFWRSAFLENEQNKKGKKATTLTE
ncbi:PadR family transcriptional regulator [Chloroflexota bacterium]